MELMTLLERTPVAFFTAWMQEETSFSIDQNKAGYYELFIDYGSGTQHCIAAFRTIEEARTARANTQSGFQQIAYLFDSLSEDNQKTLSSMDLGLQFALACEAAEAGLIPWFVTRKAHRYKKP